MIGSIGAGLTLVAVSILLTAFFSSSETALVSLGSYKVKYLLQTKGKLAKPLELWLKNPNKMLNTILLCNTLAKIGGSIIAGDITARYYGSEALGYTVAVMTAIVLVAGEIFPKTLARHNAANVAMINIRLLRFFYYICFPISWVLYRVTATLFNKKGQDTLTEDDLAFMIDVSEEEGVIGEQKQQMLSSIFDISEVYVKKVMVPRTEMVAVPDNISKKDLISLIQKDEYSRIPVYSGSLDRITGILHVKDIIKLPDNWKIEDLMETIHPALFVPETKKVDLMLREFQRARQQMAVVIDEYGGVSGIVTMEDVLEEIVGEIWDEYDADETDNQIHQITPNHYRINALINIDNFCEYFNIEKTSDIDEYDTVAGLVFDIAGAIPKVGDRFTWKNYTFVVQSMHNNKLEFVDLFKENSNELTD